MAPNNHTDDTDEEVASINQNAPSNLSSERRSSAILPPSSSFNISNDETTDDSGGDPDERPPKLPLRFDLVKTLSGVFGGITEGEDSKLHMAARRGDSEEARRLLSGRPIKKRDVAGINALKQFPHLRFAHENYEDKPTEEGLKYSQKMLNSRNRLGATPVWIAAASGHTETVEALCECGSNLEIPDIKGQTPLFAASKYNNVACVKVLLDAGANPDGSSRNISTPIYIAARENLPDVVRLLIEYGADVNGRYAEMEGSAKNTQFVGSVPLYMTLVYQNYECFRLLILNGAELHAATNERGYGTSLVTGVLRHQCDVRYMKLIALCGGIKHGDKEGIDEAVSVFRQFTHGLASTRKECLDFLDFWTAQPMTLTQLCRITIRRQMGQKRLKNFTKLKLPRQVHRYVLFSEQLKN